jgi:transcription initiation factor TFIIB
MESLWNIYEQMKEELDDETNSSGGDNGEETGHYDKDRCYSCGEREFLVEDGCMICQNCGRVNGQEIDYNQEWRYYGNDDNKGRNDPTRCGIPINPLLPDSSLGTIILGNGQQMCRRLHRWNSSNPKERSLIHAYNEINEKTSGANIPVCIVDKAKVVYKTLSSEKIKRGTTRKGLMAACIYYTLKDKQISRSTREISTIFDLKQKKMTTGCKYFNEIMYSKNRDYLNQIQPTTTRDFIERFSQKLGINEELQTLAIHICQLADKLGIISESTPPSIAVGCLYLMIQHFGFNITKKYLSEVCEISEVTISKSYKKLLEFKQYLIPEDTVVSNISENIPISSSNSSSGSLTSSSSGSTITTTTTSDSQVSSDISINDGSSDMVNDKKKKKTGATKKKKNAEMAAPFMNLSSPHNAESVIQFTNLSFNSTVKPAKTANKTAKMKTIEDTIETDTVVSSSTSTSASASISENSEKERKIIRLRKKKEAVAVVPE